MSTQSRKRLLEMLSSMLIQITALQTQTEPGATAVRDGLKQLEQMTRETLALIRAADDEEPLAELEGTTLAEALSHMIEGTAEMLGISSRVSFSGVDEENRPREHTLHPTAARLLYLIAREALYQVRQRTGTRHLRLSLSYGKEDVQMNIEDDGLYPLTEEEEMAQDLPAPPFTPQRPPSSEPEQISDEMPIMNDLRYRLAHIGGTLNIEHAGERDTRVTARVPYAPHVHDRTNGFTSFVASPPLTSPEEAPPENEIVQVLIVDSQAVTRAGLHRLLETYPGIQVVGEAADGVQATSEALELGPRVILMDTQLPNGQSLEALRQVKQVNQDIKVLMISTLDREEYLYETLRAGADGYVLKDIAPDELVQAIRAVARGEVLVQPQLAGRLLSHVGRQRRGTDRYDTLTTRELEVLRLLARGLRNKEIAARLYVSERTVNFHLANIYQKLNVSGRTEAISKALEQGLITA